MTTGRINQVTRRSRAGAHESTRQLGEQTDARFSLRGEGSRRHRVRDGGATSTRTPQDSTVSCGGAAEHMGHPPSRPRYLGQRSITTGSPSDDRRCTEPSEIPIARRACGTGAHGQCYIQHGLLSRRGCIVHPV